MFNSYFMLYKAKKTIRNIIKHPRLTLGKDVYVDPTAFMIGRNNIAIGDYSIVGEFSRFNVNKRDAEIRIRIGKNCLINRGTFFLTSNLIDVKDYFLGGGIVAYWEQITIFSTPPNPMYAASVMMIERLSSVPMSGSGQT